MTADSVHILIAEDSPTQALQLAHLLRAHFPQVSVARHGAEALALLAASLPTLIISDVNMPEMDGYEFCRRVKAEPRWADIPFLLLTSLTDPNDVMRGLECGACGFLTKPYDEAHLLERIRCTLENRKLRLSPRGDGAADIFFNGVTYRIAAGREQILDFLLSTYELALAKNRELGASAAALEARTRELERSNAELEQFASIASHDLQEPLRMVSSYLGLLEHRAGTKLDEKEKTFIGFAVDGAKRMQQMIGDLLTFSRVSTRGRTFAQADLGEVLRRALENLQVAIAESGATITHDAMPAARVDASQFTQLFQNLIGNALKFRGERAPAVHISCTRSAAGEWVFAVRDNGIGIEAKDFERIFQLFQRLHSRAEYPGTGLGLAICKKIVERHGGQIGVESRAGEGTTFTFTVPAGEESGAKR